MNNSTDGIHIYHVYIITNKNKTVFYIGVTNHLSRRLFEHSENIRINSKTFASRYNCEFLLYFEKFTWIQEAIAREKEIKGWRRSKKEKLIETINEKMNFLNYLFPYHP